MKFICTQENLNKGLNIVSHISSKNMTLPILNNVLIKATEGGIKLITTNLEIGISVFLRGKVENEGEFTVQARLLAEYISLLPKENIELNLSEDNLNIKCGNYKTIIKGMGSSDFPLIPEIEKNNEIKIKADDLKMAISQVIFATTQDEARPEISGVLFSFLGQNLVLVGTDSYRLAEKKIKLKSDSALNKDIIVPIKTLQEVYRIISENIGEDVILNINDNQLLFRMSGDVEIISRLIEGQYPDYKQILPAGTKTAAKLSTTDLGRVIKSASLFCKPGINDVKISVNADKKQLTVASLNSSIGENSAVLEAEISGESNEAVFNYRYLLDGLNNINAPEVSVEFISSSAPGLLKPVGDDNYLYLVMPIRQ